MSDYDAIICGSGSGGGAMVFEHARRNPFHRILLLELGQDPGASAAEVRADTTQSLMDDVVGKTIPYRADPVLTDYGTNPASPYFGSGYSFTVPGSEQGMGKRIGGSDDHNGEVSITLDLETSWEWDYLLRNGRSIFAMPATNKIVWAGGTGTQVLNTNAATQAAVAAELASGRAVYIGAGANPANSPMVRVLSTGVGPPSITVTTEVVIDGAAIAGSGNAVLPFTASILVDAVAGGTLVFNGGGAPMTLTGVLGAPAALQYQTDSGTTDADAANLAAAINGTAALTSVGISATVQESTVIILGATSVVVTPAAGELSPASGVNVFGSPWNSARMLECKVAIEQDIDSTDWPGGVNPFGVDGAVHGVDGYRQIGRQGRRRTLNTNPAKPWLDQRPGIGASYRQSTTDLAVIQSIVDSTATAPVGPPPLFPPPDDGVGGNTLPYLDDLNGWEMYRPAGVPSGTPWGRVFQTPSNCVGFITSGPNTGEPVCGGHGMSQRSRYDKYNERRSVRVTCIDPTRNFAIMTLTISGVLLAPYAAAAGDSITGGFGATADVVTADVVSQVVYTLNLAFLGAAVGDAFVSVAPPGKSAVLAVAPEMIFDGAPKVKLVLTIDPGSAPFTATDTFSDTTAVIPGGTVEATPVPTITQRLQCNLTSQPTFSNGETFTLSSGTVTGTVNPPQMQLTILDEANVVRVDWAPTPRAAFTLGGCTADPVVGDVFTGDDSGATATILSVETIVGANGIPGRAYVKATVNGVFIPGEPITSVAPFTGRAAKVTPILRPSQVVYDRHGEDGIEKRRYTVTGDGVFLACHAIGTAAILQRSGIGSADRLSAANVEQVMDLPGCGANILQHPLSFPLFFFFGAGADPTDIANLLITFDGIYRSSQNRAGAGFEVGANNPTGPVLFDESEDAIMIWVPGIVGQQDLASASLTGAYGLGNKQFLAGPVVQAALPPGAYAYSQTMVGGGFMAKPRSRGDGVFIQSDDPTVLPRVDHGICKNFAAKEAEAMLEILDQLYAKLTDAAVVGGFQATTFAVPFRGPPVGSGATAARVDAVLSRMSAAYHIVGSCAMAPPTDSMGVCDERGRLRNVEGLRICDGSIFPTMSRGNPAMSIVMAAHNIARMVEEDGFI